MRSSLHSLPCSSLSIRIAIVALGLTFVGVGCDTAANSTAPKSATAPKSESRDASAANVSESSAVSEETSQLEAAGVKLDRDSSTGQVTGVDFGNVSASDALAYELAGLTSVVRLTLRQSTLSDVGWKALGRLTHLQQVDLRGCEINNQQLHSVIANASALRALRLSGQDGKTTVDDEGMASLAACPELKVLAADHLGISTQGLGNLAECKKLVELYLAGTLVDDDAAVIVAGFPALKKLRLAKTSFSSVGLSKLSELPLEDLDLSECNQVSDDAMVAVGEMQQLKRLNLWRTAITNEGLTKLQSLTKLEWLNLDALQIDDSGLDALQGMTKLKFLHLGSTGVTDAGMSKLSTLKALEDLKVTRTAVTEQGVAVVKSAIPAVDVQLEYVAGQ